ncbi:9051_t:CDS:10, partial [Scutellospora calospora]
MEEIEKNRIEENQEEIQTSQIEENQTGEIFTSQDTLRKCRNRKEESSQHRKICLNTEEEMDIQNEEDEIYVLDNENEMDVLKDENEMDMSVLDNEDEIDTLDDTNLQQEVDMPQNKLNHVYCLTCNEKFPSIVLVMGECYRCYSEKTLPKKFSLENNMDPGEVPEELQGLTEIEEMLIAQVFPVMVVYRLCGGQYGYRGNIINFPQDIEEFTTCLPRHPSSLNVLIVRRHSERDSASFKDFRDSFIDDQLQNNQLIDDDFNEENEDEDEVITRTFVPCYMAWAFPTLYPTGYADLHVERIRDVKLAEYFKHLLQYKDGRFARYNRWRYFALNSQMRWRALQEGKVYVRQNFSDNQLTVTEIQEKIAAGDTHMADRIMRFGSQGLIFFTFSTTDLHWPELHKLMLSEENYNQNIIDNPHIATWGSVHVHRIGKIRNASKIEWEQIKEDESSLRKVVQYIDSLVTMINPRPNAPIPDRHPCKKCRDELHDDLQDYIELEESNYTFLRDDIYGNPELITARNDAYINPHNRLQIQGWRANVDLKPILSIHVALQYICKYASKAEPRSLAFSEILDQILHNKRDISAQETCHLLLGIPLYHSSRTFVSLNINKEIGPNSILEHSFDLGSRDIDRNHDWINEKSTETDENVTLITDVVDYQTLNEKQKIIFDRVESHYHNVLKGFQVELLRIIIIGTANTGKSYLIKAIR